MIISKRFFSTIFEPSSDTKSSPLISLHSVSTPTPNTPANPATFPLPLSTTVFRYTVPHHHTNPMGNLHGGAAATIFDICTTLALAPISKPGMWMLGGVSRALNVTYLRPAPEGEKVLIVCDVVAAGRQMASTKASMVRERDGVVLSTCLHEKVNTDAMLKGKL